MTAHEYTRCESRPWRVTVDEERKEGMFDLDETREVGCEIGVRNITIGSESSFKRRVWLKKSGSGKDV